MTRGSSLDTTSLNSFNDTASLNSRSTMQHQGSGENQLDSDLHQSPSSSSSKIMENYLILDRLNKKQQRKQQQLKLKQIQQEQQLNELRRRQMELEAQLGQIYHSAGEQENGEATGFNSKLTAHYAIPSHQNNVKIGANSNTNNISTSPQHQPQGVSNLRLALQQQLSQQSQSSPSPPLSASSSSSLRYNPVMIPTHLHHLQHIDLTQPQSQQQQQQQTSETYQFVQVCLCFRFLCVLSFFYDHFTFVYQNMTPFLL